MRPDIEGVVRCRSSTFRRPVDRTDVAGDRGTMLMVVFAAVRSRLFPKNSPKMPRRAQTKPLSYWNHWRALRESNPCFRRERAASWTARRRARTTRKRRCGKGATYKAVCRLRQDEPAGAVPPGRPRAGRTAARLPRARRKPPPTNARYWASRSMAPWVAAPRLSATARSIVCQANARTPSCRRAAGG